MMSFLFGEKEKPLKEQVKEWSRELKRQQRNMDRDIEKIKREEMQVKAEIKKAAKNNQKNAVRTLAKSLIKSQRARDHILESKTRINSVILTLETTAAQVKVGQVMAKSTQLMKGMQKLISLPQLQQVCVGMAKEMHKAGLVEDMIDEAFSMTEDPDLEEAADEEVDKVVAEVTNNMFSSVADIKKKAEEKKDDDVEETQANKEDEELNARLAKLTQNS